MTTDGYGSMSAEPSEADGVRDALPVLLRWRPVSTEEAAEVLGLSIADTRACLAQLAADGYLVWDGDAIGYQSPEQRSIAEVTARLVDVRRGLDAVENVLQQLPILVESWATRSHLEDPHVIEMLRGPVPLGEIWTRQLSWQPPARVSLMMPEILTAEDAGQDVDVADEYLRESGVDLRCIVAADSVPSPDPGVAFAGVAPSAKVRIHPRVPSWMMVSDQTVVLPAQWGRADLVDLVLVSHRPLAQAMMDFFDLLWDQSVPVPGRGTTADPEAWDGLLAMLERGTTVEAAGRALGFSPRTAQRRVRAAMTHYRVQSHFALGTAWARDIASRRAAAGTA